MSALLKKSTETATPSSAASGRMSITSSRDALVRVLKRLGSVAPRRATLPILRTVLIRVNATGVVMTATDLDISLTVTGGSWSIDSVGNGIAVNAKSLLDVVTRMPAGDIRIERAYGDRPIVTVTGGTATAQIEGISDRDYPKIHDGSGAGGTSWSWLSASALSNMFDRTAFSVCEDETRFHICGIAFESDGSMVRTISTDGHRLTKCQRVIPGAPRLAKGVIVPTKGAAQIVKLLGKRAQGDCEVGLSTDTTPARMFVRYQGSTLSIRLIDRVLPPYDQVIARHDKLASVDRKALISALTRASVLCSPTTGTKISIGEGELHMTAHHRDLGSMGERIPADGCGAEGPVTSFGVSPFYLLDLLAEIDDKYVTIAYGDELDPIVVRGTGDAVNFALLAAPFLGVIMPMRI